MEPEELERAVEAVLFAAGEPVELKRLRLDRLGNQRVYAGLVQFQKHQFSVRILQAVCVGHHRSTQDSLQVLALWDIWMLPIAELCAV